MIYYHNTCTTCGNVPLKLVRDGALKNGLKLDERYIGALPRWKEEAEGLIAKAGIVSLPFLFDEKNNRLMDIPQTIEKEDTELTRMWKEEIDGFMKRCQ